MTQLNAENVSWSLDRCARQHAVSRLCGFTVLCVSVVGWLLLAAWMLMIVPRHEEAFRDFSVELPAATVALLDASHGLRTPAGIVGAVLVMAIHAGVLALLLRGLPKTGVAVAIVLLLVEAAIVAGALVAVYVPLQQMTTSLQQTPQ